MEAAVAISDYYSFSNQDSCMLSTAISIAALNHDDLTTINISRLVFFTQYICKQVNINKSLSEDVLRLLGNTVA